MKIFAVLLFAVGTSATAGSPHYVAPDQYVGAEVVDTAPAHYTKIAKVSENGVVYIILAGEHYVNGVPTGIDFVALTLTQEKTADE